MNLKDVVASGRRFKRKSFTHYRSAEDYDIEHRSSYYHIMIPDAIADDWELEPLVERICSNCAFNYALGRKDGLHAAKIEFLRNTENR